MQLLTMGLLKILTPEQKAHYGENGFVKLTNIFTQEEINELSNEYDVVFEQKLRENADALESTWAGDDVKNLAGNKNVTVGTIFPFEFF